MGKQIPVIKAFTMPDGTEVTIETGKLATQADGSVVVKIGNTMLFAVVTCSPEAKPDQSFFPLSVDYQERFSAAGRIPGNFFRREGRINDYEILISRLIDRAIRPLFPDNFMNETQIIVNLVSSDKETMPDAYAALAASAALAVSNVPFFGPISEVRVAKIDGKYYVNPSRSALATATLDVIVGATMQDVTMVEGEANECSEHELIEAIKIGHDAIKIQIKAQLELAEMAGATQKREVEEVVIDQEVYDVVKSFAAPLVKEMASAASDKAERKAKLKEISKALKAHVLETKGEEYAAANGSKVSTYFDKIKKDTIRHVILDSSLRLDGRKLDEVRPIWTEVDYLPSTHGSAIFNRGETQALAALTLGTKLDEMMFDTALLFSMEKFILHYNFPGFSVGEVKPNRGPGRREIGHANLAARSLKKIIPENPYTLRIVSDILESNGSSSMATVCAGSLALMDAGIKMPNHVAGIAMGMIAEGGKTAILSDILGDEDALGDMDFKLTGTVNGITGCQMDIKVDGMPYELLEKALLQARTGRLHIISKMNETISTFREDYKPHAPRIVEIIIERSQIGSVIGPGGSIIQDIQRKSGAVITITEEGETGIVNISSPDKSSIEAALARVKEIVFIPSVGDEVDAVVKTLMPYGCFVDFGGKSALLHVSEMSYSRIDNVEDAFKEGDKVKVKIIEYDKKTGKYRVSRKALLPPPPPKEPKV
jgi:polyribonucleotide nucleotidyltransferase